MSESQMDSRGIDTADAGGYMPESGGQRKVPISQQNEPKLEVIKSPPIEDTEFNASEYKVCPKIGKAVIVSNFMDDYVPRQGRTPKDPECRKYASTDCHNLETVLKTLGFEPLTGDKTMVYKNLTKSKFTELYKRVAQRENYRQRSVDNKEEGYTCVLFVVMSYGRSGLIKCHAEDSSGRHEYAEQKDLQEAFQPQNNHSLALKPKIFIVQTIPEETDTADNIEGKIPTTTKRIPREADFLTYSSDSYCLNSRADNPSNINNFTKAVVDGLNELVKCKEEGKPALEIQRLLIKMNNNFKKTRKEGSDWKIPCITSSLTKQLNLF